MADIAAGLEGTCYVTRQSVESVGSILKAKKEAAEKQAAAQSNPGEAKYIEGFQKKAAEMGVDPKALAQYFLATHAAKEQATK